MILSIKKLDMQYGKDMIFHHARMKIKKHNIYGLVAPNGSGKTTLLQIIDGLLCPQNSEITVLNQPIQLINRKEVAFLQDNSVLYPYLTGTDHLQFICQIHHLSKKRIKEVCQKLQMTDFVHKKVKTYSLGMKQRLLLAIAMIKKPKLLLLDEPLNGLDPTSRLIVRETLNKMADDGVTMLISSHDLSELDKLTQSIFFIRNHKIHFEQLDQQEKERLLLTVENEKPLIQLLRTLGITKFTNQKSGTSTVISIKIDKNQSISIIEKVLDEKIPLLATATEPIGSEERYKELYEGTSK